MLNRAVAIGMSLALGSLVVFSHSGSAQAQRQSTAQRGVNGYNVTQANYGGGFFRETGNGRWTEYDPNGHASYSFTETGRDEWSVYLNDRSRDVQLQLDLHRKWVSYGQNGDGKSDLYRITSSSRRQIATQSPGRTQNTRDVNAGPIWNQRDAESKCPAVAAAQGGQWTGQWRTKVKGKMSVCEIRF